MDVKRIPHRRGAHGAHCGTWAQAAQGGTHTAWTRNADARHDAGAAGTVRTVARWTVCKPARMGGTHTVRMDAGSHGRDGAKNFRGIFPPRHSDGARFLAARPARL